MPLVQNPTNEGSLPDYDDPPLVETVLSVQFDRLPGLTNAHLGAFWKSLPPGDWPSVSDAPPLPAQVERFGESARWVPILPQLTLSTQVPATRLQIKNSGGDRMIQLQNGRLCFNWLGQSGQKYPRYQCVRDEGFSWALERFLQFVADEKLGDFRPDQWEVLYLNHIPKGTVWNSPEDWGFFRPLSGVRDMRGVVPVESFDGQWHFVIPDERGRLHVQWRPGQKPEPVQQELIVLTFTARGPLQEDGDQSQRVLSGLDLGRKTIVCSFKNLMSDDANRHWGLKYVND